MTYWAKKTEETRWKILDRMKKEYRTKDVKENRQKVGKIRKARKLKNEL